MAALFDMPVSRDEFEKLWLIHLKKTHKEDARKEYAKLGVTTAMAARILAALIWQTEQDFQHREWRMIPDLRKWLHAKAWENVIPERKVNHNGTGQDLTKTADHGEYSRFLRRHK